MQRGWAFAASQASKIVRIHHKWNVLEAFYTWAAFSLVLIIFPAVIIMYILISATRLFWLRVLEHFYPELEFVESTTVRTTVDTWRNQGIITVVLQVKGTCNLEQFINKLQADMINRKKDGQLMFPHLRCHLTSLWGWYAWQRGSEVQFDINNHVTMTPPVYSSDIHDDNCQKFISDMSSKYIRSNHPPWHMLVIPSTSKFYVLIRLHHLYLSEDRLGLGELLMLQPESSMWSQDSDDYLDHDNILAGTFKTPVALPQVYQHICESLANSWNELVSVYEPLENPKIICTTPTLKRYSILFAIVTVSAMKIYFRSNNKNITALFKQEAQRRGLTGQLLWRSLMTLFDPIFMGRACLEWAWWISIRGCLQFVHMLLYMPVFFYWSVLSYHALREIWYLTKIIIVGPKMILHELLFAGPHDEAHHLQTVSLCGRKSVSWSDPVSLDYVHHIQVAIGASSCEILLAAVSASLRDYFHDLNLKVPQSVMTTARFIPQEKLLSQSTGPVSRDSGLLCIELPLLTHDEPVENLRVVQTALYSARDKQAPLYLASFIGLDHSLVTNIFPSILARIFLNLMSRRYAVTLTQVDATSNEKKRRRLLWGQEVEDIMYWRPPQAKISMSLTLMSYGDTVRLGVMVDSQISPHHTIISSNFDKHVAHLADVVGVEKMPFQSPVTS